jgi:hypothetical protein
LVTWTCFSWKGTEQSEFANEMIVVFALPPLNLTNLCPQRFRSEQSWQEEGHWSYQNPTVAHRLPAWYWGMHGVQEDICKVSFFTMYHRTHILHCNRAWVKFMLLRRMCSCCATFAIVCNEIVRHIETWLS